MGETAARISGRLGDERGFLMVALLVAMSVMAIWMGAALPAWRTLAQREKEAELVFRGEQYARAIGLFQRRYANAAPPNVDVLINEKFLRKKYKDPITNGDFQFITPGTALSVPGAPQQQTQAPSGANPSGGRGSGIDLSPSGGRQGSTTTGRGQTLSVGPRPGAQPPGPGGGPGGGGIVGVVSKSTERSFRLYNGRDTYNQWVFMAIQQSARAGGPGGAPPGVGNNPRGIGPGNPRGIGPGGTNPPRGTGPRGTGPVPQPPTGGGPRGGPGGAGAPSQPGNRFGGRF
jgi:type II secretory pathway pseudopilin PulG